MMEIRFTIPRKPVAKGRHRMTRQGFAYTPAPTARAERTIGQIARQAMAALRPFDGPVEIDVTFVFLWPKAATKKRRADPVGKYKDTKPDVDNLVKLVKDACNKIVWRDDGCVAKINAVKEYGDRAETRVVVRPIVSGLFGATAHGELAGEVVG